MERGHETHCRIGGQKKSESHNLVPNKQGEGNSCSRNSNVAEIIDKIISVGSLAIVWLVIKIKGRRKAKEVNASMLLEEQCFLRITWNRTEVWKG